MDISDLAQIITGLATFTVAVVLVLQLRKQNHQLDIQNKDHALETSYRNMESHLGRISTIFNNSDFRKIFLKRNNERKDLNDEEYLALNYYFRSMIGTLNTSFTTDDSINDNAVKFLLGVVFETKIGKFWYKDEFESMSFVSPELKRVVAEVYESYI